MNTITYTHCDPLMLLETVGYDKEIFTDWVTLFLSECLTQFEAVVLAAKQGDMKALEFECHALKGTVGQTGADKLVEMLLALETESHQGHANCPPERLQAIREEIMLTREEMQHFLDHGEFPEE